MKREVPAPTGLDGDGNREEGVDEGARNRWSRKIEADGRGVAVYPEQCGAAPSEHDSSGGDFFAILNQGSVAPPNRDERIGQVEFDQIG